MLLARLTEMPLWLDERGPFAQVEGDGWMEYWSENHQVLRSRKTKEENVRVWPKFWLTSN